MKIEFKESQKFTQWWLWLILTSILLFFVYGLYKQLYLGQAFGDNPMSDTGLIFSSVAVTVLFLMFFFIKLKTTVNSEGIQMSFLPFKRKKVVWSEVENIRVLNYGFVGGWGVRLWTKYGTVYNIKGKKGLFIELKNGKKFLIGTQKEEELAKVVEFLMQQ